MKSLSIFIFCLFLSFTCYTQVLEFPIQLSGTILDSSTRQPIDYATVSIFKTGDKKPVSGAVSNNRGHFEIDNLAPGDYSISVEFIGYVPFTITHLTISATNNKLVLPEINLVKQANQLQEVTVIGQKKLIENKIDRLVFNAERDISSLGGVATDLLKKVPMVSVDIDGNVELAGSTSVRFLINGKPSTSYGANITDVLQSIPASEIKSIEVITSPGAKYDAQGLGGIINIILKQSNARGINGNLSVSAGTLNENGSLNLNARRNNFGLNAFASANARLLAATPSTLVRNTYDTITNTSHLQEQQGSNDVKRKGMQTGFGFDWTYKKKNNFNGNLRYEEFSNKASGQNEQVFYDYSPPGNQVNNYSKTAITSNAFATHSISGSLNYKRTYAREGQELEVALNTSKNNTTIHAGSEQFLHPTDSLIYGTKNSNRGTETGTEFQADYTQPINNEVKMGFGGKMVSQHIIGLTDVHSLDPYAAEYYYNYTLSNEFDYKQHIYALYSEIQFPLKSIADVKIGGRYERTEIDAQYSNATQKINMPGYNTFVPSVYLSRKLTEKQLLKLSYVKRINRPETQDLNPYINTTDPKNISAGNPYLTPEIGHRIELAYNLQFENTGTLMVSWFYRSSHNDIQPFNIFYPVLEIGDTTYYNVNYSSSQNIGLEQNTGFNIFTDLRIRNKLSIRPNLFFFYRKITNTIDAGYNSRSFNYRMNVNVNYEFTKTLVGEFFGNFNSPRHEAQGKYPSYTSYSFAFRKQFWNKKGSIALLANNPFGKYLSQKTEIFGPNFNTSINRHIPIRSFGINFSWKFGRLEFLKDKNSPENPGNGSEDSVK